MPTQNPVVLLWFFFLVAWMSVLVANVQTVPALSPRSVRAGWLVAAILAVAHAGGHLLAASGPLAVSERARRFQRPYVEGAYAPEPLSDSSEFRWTDDESRFILPARSRWLVMRLWVHHPDVAERPVRVKISTPCGVLFEQDLRTSAPISVGIRLPAGTETVDAVIAVSRTWTPADYGDRDTRPLGVAVFTDFVDSRDVTLTQDYGAEWRECPENR
jgi:hypothetical protein